jgi:hypothetical protein
MSPLRGVFCKQGHDEWARRTMNGKPRWTCVPCGRKASRERARTRRRDLPRRLFELARDRAARKLLPFAITPEDIRAVWPGDNRCPVLGTPLRAATLFADDDSPTLDRVDPDRGYVPGNLVVMSLRANRAKGNMSVHEIEKLFRWMQTQPATR